LRPFDRSKPVHMTENERRGELAALLSRALCRLGHTGQNPLRNPIMGLAAGPKMALSVTCWSSVSTSPHAASVCPPSTTFGGPGNASIAAVRSSWPTCV